MSATITAIADKDIGSVLGAISETSAEEVLELNQVVAKTGLPLRLEVPVTLEVPRDELKAWAGAGPGMLTDPRSYVVKDGVPAPAALKVTSIALKVATGIEIAFAAGSAPTAEVQVKVIHRNRTDGTVEVLPAAKYQPANPIVVGATLRSGEDHDALVMVEGYQAFFEEEVMAS
jgi:hypothetical protein